MIGHSPNWRQKRNPNGVWAYIFNMMGRGAVHLSFQITALVIGSSLMTFLAGPANATLRVVKGTITDIDSHQPIAFATVQLVGTGRATLSNDRGEYRLLIEADSGELKFSHIAYYSEHVPLAFKDSIRYVDISLRPSVIELPGQEVYLHDYDAAQRIILEAIKRKKDILSQLHDYRFDAYTKLIVRDLKKPDSTNIFLLTETQLSSFWEQPDKYKEIIRARKQSANLPAEGNLVTVGEILNFNKNRLAIGDYRVVTPTASDALDWYNYYLTDSIMVDGRRVFVLDIEPKSQVVPLFVGTIHIVDSTFDVVAVDVGFNKGFRMTFMRDPRYSQKFAQFENKYWMPVEIRFSGKVKFPVPIPGIPAELSFAHLASLNDFAFETGLPKGTFNEYALEVDPKADERDTIRWNAQQTVPLTADELHGYKMIDSIQKAPKPIFKRLLIGLAALPFVATFARDIFHFNRVEGAYVGVAGSADKVLKNTEINFKTGYAFSAKRWENQLGISHDFWKERRLWVGMTFSDQIVPRPTITSPWDGNTTIPALFLKEDPLDYYRQQGFSLHAQGRVLPFTTLRLGFHNYKQTSLSVNTDYSFFHRGDSSLPARPNSPIVNGQLRSVTASLNYDSRKLIDSKGKDMTMGESSYLLCSVGIEYASPKFIHNDFDFRRYYTSVTIRRPVLGLGASALHLYAGGSDGVLPPQEYFTMPASGDIFAFEQGFQNLDTVNFSGTRVASITLRHSFERLLWGKSGIPLVKKIPFTLDIYGGIFWTDFRNRQAMPGDGLVRTAPTPYREIGFSIGNLTPFLAPLNLSLGFTWQLSKYDHTQKQLNALVGFQL